MIGQIAGNDDPFRLYAVSHAGKDAVAQTTIQTFARFAVVPAQLNESLRRESVAAFYSGICKHPHYGVAFRLEAVEQLYGSLHAVPVVKRQAISIEHRGDHVDYQYGYRILAQCSH